MTRKKTNLDNLLTPKTFRLSKAAQKAAEQFIQSSTNRPENDVLEEIMDHAGHNGLKVLLYAATRKLKLLKPIYKRPLTTALGNQRRIATVNRLCKIINMIIVADECHHSDLHPFNISAIKAELELAATAKIDIATHETQHDSTRKEDNERTSLVQELYRHAAHMLGVVVCNDSVCTLEDFKTLASAALTAINTTHHQFVIFDKNQPITKFTNALLAEQKEIRSEMSFVLQCLTANATMVRRYQKDTREDLAISNQAKDLLLYYQDDKGGKYWLKKLICK